MKRIKLRISTIYERDDSSGCIAYVEDGEWADGDEYVSAEDYDRLAAEVERFKIEWDILHDLLELREKQLTQAQANLRALVKAVKKFIDPVPMEGTGFSRVRKDKELAELRSALGRIGEV